MIPLAIPNLKGNERRYLSDCIDTNFVSTIGPFVSKFEQQISAASGFSETVATSSGSSALHTALLAVDVKPGDLVICPGLSFIATANAITYCQAQPWLIDIDKRSWTIDPSKVQEALTTQTFVGVDGLPVHRKTGKRVAAILPVYTLGTPADMDAIVEIASSFHVPIVADAAAALGSTYKGRNLSELGTALTIFSFNGNKTVTAGGGGAVSGNNQKIIDLVRHLTTTARVGSDYDHDRVGFNYRLTNLQAAVGCAQMESLNQYVEKKREIARFYCDAFSDLPGVRPFPKPDYANSACWFSGFVLENGDPSGLRKELRNKGIDARPFWKPLNLQLPFSDAPRANLDVSEYIWSRIVTLPCSTGISDDELGIVANSVRQLILAS